MPRVPFVMMDLKSELTAAPIQPDWITGGNPVARNAIISRSADGSTYTMVWDCTAGCFDWTYDCDETVYILEGSILLRDGGNPLRRYGAGEALFFPKGAKISWQVESYVRKLAVMRNTLPAPVALTFKGVRRIRRMVDGVKARFASRSPLPVTSPMTAPLA